MKIKYFPILAVRNTLWHKPQFNFIGSTVAIFFDLRIALTLCMCCNGACNILSAECYATGSQGFNISNKMRNTNPMEELVEDYFFTHGPDGPTRAKSTLLSLLFDHLYYVPDVVHLTPEQISDFQGVITLLTELEQLNLDAS